MAFLNQFSFVLLGAGTLLMLVFFLRRRGPAEGSLMAVVALFIGLAFAFVFFRPSVNDAITDETIEATIGTGKPVLIEFQSPYCVACMAAEPIVKQIEFDYSDDLTVIRVNVLDESFAPLLKSFQFQYTPTFILLDAQGDEIWRTVGVLDPERVGASLEALP
jgi:thiol-disulfide isomerase/thioredoxin